MKRLTWISVLGTAVLALALAFLLRGNAGSPGAPLSAATPFEGEVRLSLMIPESPELKQLVYEVKGDNFRFDLPDVAGRPHAYVIVDNAARRSSMVIDETHMVMAIDMPAPAAAARGADKVEKTAKKGRVAGHECEIWKIEAPGTRVAACVTQGLGFDLRLGAAGKSPLLERVPGVPLEMVQVDESGAVMMTLEVKSIQPRAISADRFVIPSGYKTLDALEVMAMLGTSPGAAAE
jgi:Domain of unknown function (DUF4412)